MLSWVVVETRGSLLVGSISRAVDASTPKPKHTPTRRILNRQRSAHTAWIHLDPGLGLDADVPMATLDVRVACSPFCIRATRLGGRDWVCDRIHPCSFQHVCPSCAPSTIHS